jgi:hypothetical protein
MVSDITQWSLSWKANSSWASPEITRILHGPRVHYRVCQGPPIVPILSHKSPVYVLSSCFFKIRFTVTLPPMTRSSKWSLYFTFSDQNLTCTMCSLSKLTSSAHTSSRCVPFSFVPSWSSWIFLMVYYKEILKSNDAKTSDTFHTILNTKFIGQVCILPKC